MVSGFMQPMGNGIKVSSMIKGLIKKLMVSGLITPFMIITLQCLLWFTDHRWHYDHWFIIPLIVSVHLMPLMVSGPIMSPIFSIPNGWVNVWKHPLILLRGCYRKNITNQYIIIWFKNKLFLYCNFASVPNFFWVEQLKLLTVNVLPVKTHFEDLYK